MSPSESTSFSMLMNSTELYTHIHHIGHLGAPGAAWFYVGFIANVLFLGIVFFLEKATSRTTGHMNYKSLYVLAMAAFYYMLLAQIGRESPLEATIIKYCYWMLTTPIILIQLCELLDGIEYATWVVMLDVLTMVTGLVAWIVGEHSPIRWIMFGVSCIAATCLFAVVFVLFYLNHQLLVKSGYEKEKKIYQVISAIYFPGWLAIVLVWLFGFEGLSMMGEDPMAAAHVLIDICVKDITEVLIVWVSYCLNLRLAEMTKSKMDGRSINPTDLSYMNMIASRVPRNRSTFEVLDQDNQQGMLSQVRLPSVAFLTSRKQFNADRTVKKVDRNTAPPASKGHAVYLEKMDEMADNTPTSSARGDLDKAVDGNRRK